MGLDGDRLLGLARAWIDGDPDPATRHELQQLVDAGDLAALADHVDGALEFGTAGIRGPVGAGPRRINRAVALRTARGLADHFLDSRADDAEGRRLAVVGHDARPSSPVLAGDVTAVLAARGLPVEAFDRAVPTPLVAYRCVQADATCGVVVTASHNPPRDNGIKVYASNHVQLVPPEDARIAARIAAAPSAAAINADTVADPPNLRALDTDDVASAYRRDVVALRSDDDRATDLRIVTTALHGVGGEHLARLLDDAGYADVVAVPEQAEPDGSFPTVPFPNPEEEGALDLALALAREVGADLVLANDPDADRLAVAIPDGRGDFTLLTGNQVGGLLADHLLRTRGALLDRPAVASSIVSSPLLGDLAEAHGAVHAVTLTGFKWICNALLDLAAQGAQPLYGYEEALGYAVTPLVRDKDGLSAALLAADIAASARRAGASMRDVLDDLARRHGARASVQRSVRLPGPQGRRRIDAALAALRSTPPATLAGIPVDRVDDYAVGAEGRPRWLGEQDLLAFHLGRDRVLVRPSGTEPKLKAYADTTGPAGDDVAAAERALSERARAIADDLLAAAGL